MFARKWWPKDVPIYEGGSYLSRVVSKSIQKNILTSKPVNINMPEIIIIA